MGLLLAMERHQRYLSLARIGFDVHTQPAFERTPVGGLPNHCRNRQRLRCNNGKPHQFSCAYRISDHADRVTLANGRRAEHTPP